MVIDADTTFQARVPSAQKAAWIDSAQKNGQDASTWARIGLDAWRRLCAHAAVEAADPEQLLAEALDAYAQKRAVLAALGSAAVPLSRTEQRVLELLGG